MPGSSDLSLELDLKDSVVEIPSLVRVHARSSLLKAPRFVHLIMIERMESIDRYLQLSEDGEGEGMININYL